MMMKMKGGGKSEILDDARARFKHQSLLQDYLELQKETDVARNRLLTGKDKKLTLEAEVRFLRRRYNFLLKSRAQRHKTKQPQSKKTEREKNIIAEGVKARPPVPKFESSEKGKGHKKMETTSAMRKISPSIDLNLNITNYNAQVSASRYPAHQLDLNQTAKDEDDFQPPFKPKKLESSAFVKCLTEEQLNDMKLSACRNIENAATSRGKRKISWQDQVALRV